MATLGRFEHAHTRPPAYSGYGVRTRRIAGLPPSRMVAARSDVLHHHSLLPSSLSPIFPTPARPDPRSRDLPSGSRGSSEASAHGSTETPFGEQSRVQSRAFPLVEATGDLREVDDRVSEGTDVSAESGDVCRSPDVRVQAHRPRPDGSSAETPELTGHPQQPEIVPIGMQGEPVADRGQAELREERHGGGIEGMVRRDPDVRPDLLPIEDLEAGPKARFLLRPAMARELAPGVPTEPTGVRTRVQMAVAVKTDRPAFRLPARTRSQKSALAGSIRIEGSALSGITATIGRIPSASRICSTGSQTDQRMVGQRSSNRTR